MVAAQLLRGGRLTQAEIARRLGVSRATVTRWQRRLEAQGVRGLRRRRATGRPSHLRPDQWRQLLRLLRRGAMAAGFETERWTVPRIATVVERTFGVRYHPRSLGLALPRPCLDAAATSDPRPGARRRADCGVAQARLAAQHKGALRSGRAVLFLDETGHTFLARLGTTWAPRGQPPRLRRVSQRRALSSIVALVAPVADHPARRYARHVPGSVHGEQVIVALRHFRRQVGCPLVVIWDRLHAHRSRRVQAFVAAHPNDFQLEWLPPYVPDLNLEVLCHGVVKQELLNAIPASVAELHRLARRAFRRLGRRPDVRHHFFHHVGLTVTLFS